MTIAAEQNTPKKEGGKRTKGCVLTSSSDRPLVSVITVVYNGEAHLAQTMASVLGQSYDNIEYIIVDGGSTDGTVKIIRRFENQIDYWVSESDQGIYDAMNKGIDLAHGDLIGLLNADDYYEPEAIKWVVGQYQKDQEKTIYYGNNYVIQEDLKLRYKSYPHMQYWRGMCVCHQALFVHKDVYGIIGKYDTHFKMAADYHFILRSFFSGISYRYINEFLVNYRNTGLSSDDYLLSIGEAKDAHKMYYTNFSFERFVYLLFYYKTFFIFYLQKVINAIFGPAILNKIRSIYLKLFYAKERQLIE